MSDYVPLPKESFISAEWLGPDEGLEDVAPRWQGYSANLPNRGVTTLYPLSVSSYGPVCRIYTQSACAEKNMVSTGL